MERANEDRLIQPDEKTLTYDKYLKIHELLSLQQELSEPKEHDETLFIIIHQSYELWFKQILHEVLRCQSLLDRDEILPVLRSMKRIDTIQKVLIQKVDILETMAPDEFNRFRDRLNPASGFQSHQFRILEYKLGLKNKGYFKYHQHEPDTLAKLEKTLKEPSLYDSFFAFLARQGYQVPEEVLQRDLTQPHQANPKVVDIFEDIYRNHLNHYEIYSFLESLVDLDEQFTIWRYRHMLMVSRMIGSLTGTGGSLGAKYLATTLEKTLFPEIWNVRNQLGVKK
ncbi:tryptophan 2,3-dioxygenase [Pseudobacteriovorax antillogorgiicola]|uniref:Tryptophan 2,3-dioxygenase n=1 Tax=Pseudobacteriovorax antillogorgiicola TaxID=1513793 RepID=A0A1Y6CBI8_9BACT|nr:tryptophan 2,3-dioxygenase family protein [Pseudobacteriovorax antillogorgiicola]TCS49462.1 tryptophan 2,3-dioxygenase [Pseudobacteriovorax antillogorgiicola]SMF46342.1 tryptophan 2,3-dioxygenase [Pseudobacteriovorax antillogorgiicola]